MQEEPVGLVNWSTPSNQTLIWVAVAFLVLLIGALLLEKFRQRRQRRVRAAAAWNNVESIAKEKGCSTEELRVLSAVIRRWDPDDPLRVVTMRHDFDRCVEKEMESVLQRGDQKELERTGTVLRDIRSRLALDFVPLGQRIYSTRELYQGQEVWLAREADKPPRWIRGSIALSNEAAFHVAPKDPLDSGRAAFQPDAPFRFRLFRDEDARYAFSTRYIRREKEPYELVFHHTSNLDRIQAREHYRVRHEQATNVGVMNAPLDTGSPHRDRRIVTRLRGQITNISAGGFALIVPQAIPAQVLIRVTLELELEAAEPFEVDARIVGTTPLPGGRYLIRAALYEEDSAKRELIARYVVHRQQPHHEPAGLTE
ncbi:MAG: hypothetical protein AMXMBFR82_48940 [Candidatus Hydrogenedentota bacterium]